MKETKSKSENLSDSHSEAELEKLNLEIESLRYKNKWEHRITVYIPLVSTLLAIGGLLFGIYQFQSQQRLQQDKTIAEQQKDRAAKETEQAFRIQDQIRTDVDQLLQFTSNKEITISRVIFILNDLKLLLDYSADEQHTIPKKLQEQKRGITKNLVKTLEYDCDFNNPRDVEFALSIIENWDDYLEYLKSDIDTVQIFVEKYIWALQKLHAKNPEFIESLEYDEENSDFYYKGDLSFFYEFDKLENCFKKHLDLIEHKPTLKTKYIRSFQAATCNPTLTKQLFEGNFSDVDCLH